MDKTAIKNFAIDSREKLITDIMSKARMLGIKKEGIDSPLSQSTRDMKVFNIGEMETFRIYGQDVNKYEKLIKEIENRQKDSDYKTAYTTLIEEIAYTWFNRIIAIRFMEVNKYMPDRMRVLSSGKPGVREPEFVSNFRDTDIGLSEEEFQELEDLKLDGSAKAMDEIFQFLFIKQSNALNNNLPHLFEKTDDYAELLLNISYNDPEGVIYKLIEDIKEEPFDIGESGQIEIIGWLYQYYNEVPRDQVINIYKGTVKKEDIPFATQLFTTEWVVKYMVENSLGKYWLERNPQSKLRDHMEYLMPGAIERVEEKISPEDIKVFDNAMGSGHILVYAFEILMKIYLEQGYMEREAAEKIIENNLYGLDIDKRAYQLAYFSLMMKGRQYSRRILNQDIKNNINVFQDSGDIEIEHLDFMGISMGEKDEDKALEEIEYLIKEFENAKEIGSILKLEEVDKELIEKFIEDTKDQGQISFGDSNIEETKDKLDQLLKTTEILNRQYEIVITNPPYLNKMSEKLKKYVNDNYADYKQDLFSVFIYNNIEMCKKGGYSAYMTPFVWMFIKSYEKLRGYILSNKHISSLIQMEYSAFEQATVPICTFILQNKKTDEKGKYIRLSDFKGGMEVQRLKTLEAIEDPACGYYYETDEKNFVKIPGSPIAYWASERIVTIFEKGKSIGELFPVKKGSDTGANYKYLRMFYELDFNSLGINFKNGKDTIKYNKKWVPYDKGGDSRKWYGNNSIFIFWENDGKELKNSKANLRSRHLFFKEHVTWNALTSSTTSARYSDYGALFDSAGSSMFPKDQEVYLAYMNSKIADKLLLMINPTLNYGAGSVSKLPIIHFDNKQKIAIDLLVQQNIAISKTDWDSFETSWDFKTHPLLDTEKQGYIKESIGESYITWKEYANNNFAQLKENEERLNELFIEIYGLEDELTPEVSDKDITISKIFDHKNEIYDDIKGNRYILTKEDIVKSFISYGIGCIFGRYSLDKEGLAYAGGDFNIETYNKFKPVDDNIVVLTEDEYFEDDLTNRFIQFVKIAFGEETLDDNLRFITESLRGKGTPKEILRNYFLKDFYKDHVQIYKKTPIYWLYDSGKMDGFKALIYMHRYDRDTTGRVRIDYLHRLQRLYENRIDFLRDDMRNNSDAKEVAKAEKELNTITKKIKECKDYDEKIAHLALARIDIDLDNGVKVNYEKVQTDDKGKNYKILAKI